MIDLLCAQEFIHYSCVQEHHWGRRELQPNAIHLLTEVALEGTDLRPIQDLLCDMLTYEPDDRPSARTLLQHEFFQQQYMY